MYVYTVNFIKEYHFKFTVSTLNGIIFLRISGIMKKLERLKFSYALSTFFNKLLEKRFINEK